LIRRLLIIFPFCSIILQGQGVNTSIQIGYESIQAADLKTHLSVLTSDSLEGREMTFPGQKKAANYIAGIFNRLNLEAVGDNGTYFQHFDVEVARINPETKITTEIGGMIRDYKWIKDFLVEAAKDTTVSGSVAFVGFVDTELDSVSKAKIAGRVVFVFIGKKDYSGDTSKSATMRRFSAIRHSEGAVATLMIPDYEGPATFQHAQQFIGNLSLEKGIMWIKSGKPHTQLRSIRFLVSPELAEETLKPSGKSLNKLGMRHCKISSSLQSSSIMQP
jgi:hypothetical protein